MRRAVRWNVSLKKLTSTPIKGVLLGAAVNSGYSVNHRLQPLWLLVFVNSGDYETASGGRHYHGANIGTTVTSWILSLSGIQGDSIWIQMLKPSSIFSDPSGYRYCISDGFPRMRKKHDIGMILFWDLRSLCTEWMQ